MPDGPGRIDEPTMRRQWRLFQQHRRHEYRVVDAEFSLLDRAADLLFRHCLRTYDAVQVSSALRVGSEVDRGTNFRFVTADQNQAIAADHEGLIVELIA